ncbi:MAG: hypothetical protein IJI43_03445 [Bacilli bacterium]|nr:hypothetical protein [Bacilli bacterium]
MENDDKVFILKEIDIDKEHLSSFPMETDSGTKKIKEEFHKKAIQDRNAYVDMQIRKFTEYRNDVFKMLKARALSIFPNNSINAYENINNHLALLQDAVVDTNKYVDNYYKLGFSYLIEDIDDNASLLLLNKHLKTFISKFNEMGIELKKEDFNYTMFTANYMKEFLDSLSMNDNDFSMKMRTTFDSIYWECPTIIYQIKLNLLYILDKYKKELDKYLADKNAKLLNNLGCDRNTILDEYLKKRLEAGVTFARDEYKNLEVFLNGSKNIEDYLPSSEIRSKNYNTYCNGNFDDLTPEDKNKFDFAMADLHNTLVVLKKYYTYEPIVKDLLKKYKEKDKVKTEFANNNKEIDKEDKKRLAINKEFARANGEGFLAKYNSDKIKNAKVKMNDEISKIKQLYLKKFGYEISINLDEYIKESSTLYDLFMACTSSFNYLSNQLKTIYKDEEDFNIEKEVNNFYRFIFNPSNVFLRKSTCFSDSKIETIVSDKYRLLGLNISDSDVSKASIDSTMETVAYINLIQNINKGRLSLENIAFICNVNKIEELKPEKEAEML